MFAEINITPLTDIFLVLLIIFMVTTSVTIESAAHVDLPRLQAPTSQQNPHNVLISYTADGRIYVNQKEVAYSSLKQAVHDALADSPDKLVVFEGDAEAILGDTVRILDVAKQAGARKIAIASEHLAAGNGVGVLP